MSKQKPAELGMGALIVGVPKGQAQPTPAVQSGPHALAVTQKTIETPEPKEKDGGYYKALTVKLTRQRYKDVKAAGVAIEKSTQEIMVEALDAWLSSYRGPL